MKALKASARIALVNLDEFTAATLRDSFGQLGIRALTLDAQSPERLSNEKFEACAIALDQRAVPFLEALRDSPLNSRVVIYGIGEHLNHSSSVFNRYGINAVLNLPLEKQATLRVIRASRALLLNEFRRYVRLPITTDVSLLCGGDRTSAWCEDISTGGISLKVSELPKPLWTVLLTFVLPSAGKIVITGQVCWTSEEDKRIGIRFGPADPSRVLVRSWIDSFLQIA